jgi:hypothetical protein
MLTVAVLHAGDGVLSHQHGASFGGFVGGGGQVAPGFEHCGQYFLKNPGFKAFGYGELGADDQPEYIGFGDDVKGEGRPSYRFDSLADFINFLQCSFTCGGIFA